MGESILPMSRKEPPWESLFVAAIAHGARMGTGGEAIQNPCRVDDGSVVGCDGLLGSENEALFFRVVPVVIPSVRIGGLDGR